MHLVAVLLCAFCSLAPVSAARIRVGDLVSTSVDDKPLKDFIARERLFCGKCQKVHGLLIGNLVEGLIDAGKVTEITNDGETLKVTLKNEVYGQIATRSTVPVMWVVGKELTVKVVSHEPETTIHLTGLHVDVPQQAYRFYKEIMDGAGLAEEYERFCQDTSSDSCMEYLEREHQAVREWFKPHYKKSFKQMDTSKKIGKVLQSIVKNLPWALKAAITYDNWANIVYSMITATPKTITEMRFPGGAAVVAHVEAYTDSSNLAFAQQNHLLEKAQILGGKAITNAPTALSSTLATQAKSGWGFGMMFGHGDPKVADQIAGYGKANPAYLSNLVSLCKKGSMADDPPCTGSDIGRVHWTDNVPEEYA